MRDDRFEVIGVAVKVNDGETEWASGTHEQIKGWLKDFDWANSMAIAHNMMFDGFILSDRFDIFPKVYADTLSMARALHGVEVGGSLAALAERYKLGVKGDEVVTAAGKNRLDFTEKDLDRYGDYCVNDVELTYKLFNAMIKKGFPRIEMKLIDLTTRMFTRPLLDLNLNLLEMHLVDIKEKKDSLLLIANIEDKGELASNPKFAELLKQLGVPVPMKISSTTGKETFALSKNDEEFKALAEHPNVVVQALVAARLGTKSTLEETRTERFIGIAKRGLMPVPLKYYAAHTGRWGGSDALNLQNLPSRGANAGKLKKAIIAPEGYSVIDADSSQIEARVLAWLSGQNDLVEAFAKGEDVYKIMASAIYNKDVLEITKEERFVGKTTILGCISEGTLVLCKSGWKPIEKVSLEDKVWDGEEWVCHQGLVKKGYKKTVSVYGTWLTPDHKILCGTKWVETQLAVVDESILSRALGIAMENLPLLGTSKEYEGAYPQSLLNVPVEDLNIPLTKITLKTLNLHDAIYALRNRVIQLANYIGGIATYLKITSIGKDCLIAYQAVSHAVIQSLVKRTHIMVVGGLQFTNLGAKIEKSSYATLYPSMGGMNPSETLTASTITKDTNPITYVFQPNQKMPVIKEKLVSCSRNLMTYDLAYAGPRNRFTVMTDKGPIIVHNCGYGMGAQKFGAQLKTFGTTVTEDDARHIVQIYRETYPDIVLLWSQAQLALQAISKGLTTSLGKEGVLSIEPNEKGIRLPSGLLMRYDQLIAVRGDKGTQYQYKTRYGWNKIYGGKVIENVCQAVARCIIGEQMIRIAKRYNVVLTVHDAIACVVKNEEVLEAQAYIEECMKWTPEWADGLPVSCESGYGESYGDC